MIILLLFGITVCNTVDATSRRNQTTTRTQNTVSQRNNNENQDQNAPIRNRKSTVLPNFHNSYNLVVNNPVSKSANETTQSSRLQRHNKNQNSHRFSNQMPDLLSTSLNLTKQLNAGDFSEKSEESEEQMDGEEAIAEEEPMDSEEAIEEGEDAEEPMEDEEAIEEGADAEEPMEDEEALDENAELGDASGMIDPNQQMLGTIDPNHQMLGLNGTQIGMIDPNQQLLGMNTNSIEMMNPNQQFYGMNNAQFGSQMSAQNMMLQQNANLNALQNMPQFSGENFNQTAYQSLMQDVNISDDYSNSQLANEVLMNSQQLNEMIAELNRSEQNSDKKETSTLPNNKLTRFVLSYAISALNTVGAFKPGFLNSIAVENFVIGDCALCGARNIVLSLGANVGVCTSCAPRAIKILQRHKREDDVDDECGAHITHKKGIYAITSTSFPGAGGIDPRTGMPYSAGTGGIDPRTGKPYSAGAGGIDPATGKPYSAGAGGGINPATGMPYSAGAGGIDPATGMPYAGGQSHSYADAAAAGISALANAAEGKGSMLSALAGTAGSLLQASLNKDKNASNATAGGINHATGMPYAAGGAGGMGGGINPATGMPYSAGAGGAAGGKQSVLGNVLNTVGSVSNMVQATGLGNIVSNAIANRQAQKQMAAANVANATANSSIGATGTAMAGSTGSTLTGAAGTAVAGALTSNQKLAIQNKITDLTSDISMKTTSLQKLLDDLNKAKTKLESANTKLAGASNAISKKLAQASLKKATNSLATCQKNYDTVKAAIDELNAQKQQLQAQLNGATSAMQSTVAA